MKELFEDEIMGEVNKMNNEWEKVFDEWFSDESNIFSGGDPYGSRRKALKSFIQNLLTTAITEAEERERERVVEWANKNAKELSDPYPFDSKYTYTDFISVSDLEDFLTPPTTNQEKVLPDESEPKAIYAKTNEGDTYLLDSKK